MSILKILNFYNNNLNFFTKKVKKFNLNLKKKILNMIDTMYFYKGIGLAAPQVNIKKKIFIINLSKNKKNINIFINPKIIFLSKKKKKYYEGCLSLPNIYTKINRFYYIKIKYQDINGNFFYKNAKGLLSACIQHELDHLNGIFFLKYKFFNFF